MTLENNRFLIKKEERHTNKNNGTKNGRAVRQQDGNDQKYADFEINNIHIIVLICGEIIIILEANKKST